LGYSQPAASEEMGFDDYVCNCAVIVPLCGRAADDEAALTTLRAAFPQREVVGVACPAVTYGGGVHCVTQQVILAP
jgi:agmatine deiminase